MSRRPETMIFDKAGRAAAVVADDGKGTLTVEPLDGGGRRLIVDANRIAHDNEGHWRYGGVFGDGRAVGGVGSDRGDGANAGRSGPVDAHAAAVVPLVGERLQVKTRWVRSGGVRVAVETREEDQVLESTLQHEQVDVERVPVGRIVGERAPVRTEGNVTIIPVYEQVLVPALLLKEELRVHRRIEHELHRHEATVLRQDVRITPVKGDGAPRPSSSTAARHGHPVAADNPAHEEPIMKNIVAMYREPTAAEGAQRALLDAGLPAERIDLVTPEQFYGAKAPPPEKRGLLQRIFGFGADKQDSDIYAEGIRRGHTIVRVEAAEDEAGLVEGILERFDPRDVDRDASDWQAGGWKGYDENAGRYETNEVTIVDERAPHRDVGAFDKNTNRDVAYADRDLADRDYAARGVDAKGERTIPVIEEQLRVGKQTVPTGTLRVRTYVREEPVSQEVQLREEVVSVERRAPTGATGTVDASFDDKVVEIDTFAEEAVVEKEAAVVEEVVVKKDVVTRTETVKDTVKKQVVDVDDESRRSHR